MASMEDEDEVGDFDVFGFGSADDEDEQEQERGHEGSHETDIHPLEDFLSWSPNDEEEQENSQSRPAHPSPLLEEASAVGSVSRSMHTAPEAETDSSADWVLVQERRQLPLPAYAESDNLRYALGAATGIGFFLCGPAAAAATGLLGIALLQRDQSKQRGSLEGGEVDAALVASAERRRMFWRFDLQVDHLRADLAKTLKQQYQCCKDSVRKHIRGDIEAVTAQLEDALQREAEQQNFLEQMLREHGCNIAGEEHVTNIDVATLSSRQEVMENLLQVLDGSKRVVNELERLRWNSKVAERNYEEAIRQREIQLQESSQALFQESGRVEEHKQRLEEAHHKFSQVEEGLQKEIEHLHWQVEEARRKQEETEATIDKTLQTASDRLNAKDRAAKKHNDEYEVKLAQQHADHDQQLKELLEEVARQRSAHQEAVEAVAELQKELRNEREMSKAKDQELAYKDSKLQDKDDQISCCICTEAARAIVFQPCRHSACCRACAEEVFLSSRTCPICREVIESMVAFVTS